MLLALALVLLGFVLILQSLMIPFEIAKTPTQRSCARKRGTGSSQTLSTRMKPGGRIILIMTRWNEDDLAGRLLLDMQKGGDAWDVLSLPAVAGG